MKDNKQLYKTMCKVKFGSHQGRFYNCLEKELREYVSDDVIYSHNVFPFTYHNFKRRDVRDVWIPINRSVRESYER